MEVHLWWWWYEHTNACYLPLQVTCVLCAYYHSFVPVYLKSSSMFLKLSQINSISCSQVLPEIIAANVRQSVS